AFGTAWTSSLAKLRIPAGREAELMPLTRALRRRALQRPAAAVDGALAVLARFAADTRAQYARYDLVLTPALALTPRPVGWYTAVDPEADYMRQCQYSPYSSMVNVCGLPAVTVPVHTTAAGLSMGVQLIGRPGSEAQLLAVAAQHEAVRKPPPD
ncbi:amidase, partial [Arthrobacter deserti]|nr:amidase [Arthrobacter deserti]